MKTIPTLSKFYKARMLTEYYNKITLPSGRSKWVLEETEGPRVISHEHYNNIVQATKYFRRKVFADDKSREYLKYSYTKAGYIATRNTSISPTGTRKIIRYFEIIDAESENNEN